MDPDDVAEWDHWLEYMVDGASVQLVRPSDTDRPTWAAYEEARYLGTVHSRFDLDGRWHVQSLNERHLSLDDALRALRRPHGWAVDREHVRRWARGTLSDPHLIVLDVQTTGFDTDWAVQIGVTDRDGNALFDELVNSLADITPQARRPGALCESFSSTQLGCEPPHGLHEASPVDPRPDCVAEDTQASAQPCWQPLSSSPARRAWR
ncbi:hypothetical protein ACFRQM_48385 [Streptomyces sp. NPDC056831]|uniref:hypothetical protein n=1 Tax=Streptomyces sp. NPDC056831 TaxID=3345954 RepID=UPI0036BC6118